MREKITQRETQEESKGDDSSDDLSVEIEATQGSATELTSNFAFDRFLSIGALGYSNGMIKLMRINTLKDEVSPEHANS